MNERRQVEGKGFLAITCALLMAFQPAFGASAAPIGTVNGAGSARVNGTVVPSGAVLYAGDRVATADRGAAFIHLAKGGEIVLGLSTSAQVNSTNAGFAVLLEAGKIEAVAGEKAPVVVKADGVTIAPTRNDGAYEVALHGNSLEVFSRRGTTLAKMADKYIAVPEGKLLKASVAEPSSSSKAQQSHGQQTKQLVLISLIAAGVTGVGLGVALSEPRPHKKCVSVSGLGCP